MDFGGGGFGGGGGGGFDSGPASGGFSSSDDGPGGRHGGSHQGGGSFGAGFFREQGGFGDGGRESGGNFSTDYFSRGDDTWRSHFGWGPVIAGGAAGAAAAALVNRGTGGSTTYYVADAQPGVQPGYPGQWQRPPAPYPELTDQRPRSLGWLKLLRFINLAAVVVVLYMFFFHFGSEKLQVAVREQHLLETNTFFVKSIKVTPDSKIPSDLPISLLGFPSAPSLGKSLRWKETKTHVQVRGYGYESWRFWLNKGSTITVNYNIQLGLPLLLIVLNGEDRLNEWKYSPSTFTDYEYRRTVSGSGSAIITVASSGDFYLALGNFRNYPTVVNELDLAVESRVYDLSNPSSHCAMPPAKSCSMPLAWGSGAVAVLTTPQDTDDSDDLWTVRVSYSTRWMTYFWILALIWFATYVVGKVHKRQEERRARQLAITAPQYRPGEGGIPEGAPGAVLHPPETAPLVAPEGGQAAPQPPRARRVSVLGWFSSLFKRRGSGPRDEEAQRQGSGPEGTGRAPAMSAPIPSSWVAAGQEQGGGQNEYPATSTAAAYVGKGPGPGGPSRSALGNLVPSAPPLDAAPSSVHEGVVLKDSGDTCAICMDAKKDAILVDCGHRATCYDCGKLLMEARPPLCPICRKGIRQVIKVFDA